MLKVLIKIAIPLLILSSVSANLYAQKAIGKISTPAEHSHNHEHKH